MKPTMMMAMVVCVAMAWLTGCQSEKGLYEGCGTIIPSPGTLEDPSTAPLLMNEDDVTITVAFPHDRVRQGDAITLDVIVRNETDQPIRIDAVTSAKLLVDIWRQTPVGPTRALCYPENDVQVITPWGLKANGIYVAELTIPVQRTWPTHEPLDITVTLNGTRIMTPPIRITALPARP